MQSGWRGHFYDHGNEDEEEFLEGVMPVAAEQSRLWTTGTAFSFLLI